MNIRRLVAEDIPQLRDHWKKHWGDEFVVAHGVIYRPDTLDGFVAIDGDEWVGEITYTVSADEVEIVSIDSLREGQGIGTALINAVIEEVRNLDFKRIFVITTNDNLNAMGFYQKRGFELAAIHRGAVNESRKLKPSIPQIGMNNIPLRDEIVLELVL